LQRSGAPGALHGASRLLNKSPPKGLSFDNAVVLPVPASNCPALLVSRQAVAHYNEKFGARPFLA